LKRGKSTATDSSRKFIASARDCDEEDQNIMNRLPSFVIPSYFSRYHSSAG
jgi:hypothetical protein